MEYAGRTYELSLRRERLYKPFSIQLIDFRHDVYPGTEIPKNFSSRVRVRHPGSGEDREVLIYMNNPLRYQGETFYQASFDTDNEGTILQVVRNPSWLAPYASTVMVSAGLLIQFLTHMFKFVKKRRTAV
jgi:cytochrome c biogenesis protein ResB